MVSPFTTTNHTQYNMKKQQQRNDDMIPRHCTAKDLAELLGVSTRRIKQLRSDGALVTDDSYSPPRYLLVESLAQYALYLKRDDASQEAKRRNLRATADYKERKAELMLLELRKRKGELHEARHIRAIWTQNLTEIRAAFRAIPGRTAQDLSLCSGANEIAATLRQAIDETLHHLANREYDPEEFAKMVREEGGYVMDKFGAMDDDDDEDDEDDEKMGLYD